MFCTSYDSAKEYRIKSILTRRVDSRFVLQPNHFDDQFLRREVPQDDFVVRRGGAERRKRRRTHAKERDDRAKEIGSPPLIHVKHTNGRRELWHMVSLRRR